MDLIDGLETKDLCASKQLRRALAAALFIRNNPVLCFGVSAARRCLYVYEESLFIAISRRKEKR